MTEGAPLPEFWDVDAPVMHEAAALYRLLASDEPISADQRKAAAEMIETLVFTFQDSVPDLLRPLFLDDAVFWCTHWVSPPVFEPKAGGGLRETSNARHWPAVAVLCNDLFMWGMADCEEVGEDLWQEIADIHAAHGSWGLQVWVARRRKLMPQGPVLRTNGWKTAAAAMGWTPKEAVNAR